MHDACHVLVGVFFTSRVLASAGELWRARQAREVQGSVVNSIDVLVVTSREGAGPYHNLLDVAFRALVRRDPSVQHCDDVVR